MSSEAKKDDDPNIEDIKEALKRFKDVVQQQETAHKSKQEDLLRFKKLSEQLKELQDQEEASSKDEIK